MDGYADARTFFSPFTGLSWWIALAISGSPFNALADDTIQFDGRFLDLKAIPKLIWAVFRKRLCRTGKI